MKILYLLPPSEGKNIWWIQSEETLSFSLEKPFEIAVHASEKDLKCKGKRYEQWIFLNKNINSWELLPAIERYTGIMYTAIDYKWMSQNWKKYFSDHFVILSWMYGILKPEDRIRNYKLPIETKWLFLFWWERITEILNNQQSDIIVNMLPKSYEKMIDWKKIESKVLTIEFFHIKNGEKKKISHGVKKIKGEYVKNICETSELQIPDFWNKKHLKLSVIK